MRATGLQSFNALPLCRFAVDVTLVDVLSKQLTPKGGQHMCIARERLCELSGIWAPRRRQRLLLVTSDCRLR